MNPTRIFILAIAIDVVISAYIIWKLHKFRGTDTYQKSQRGIIKLLKWEERMALKFQTSVLGLFSKQKFRGTDTYHKSEEGIIKLLKWGERMALKFQTSVLGLFSNKKNRRIKPALLLEILLIGIWAFWIGYTIPSSMDKVQAMWVVCGMERQCHRGLPSVC